MAQSTIFAADDADLVVIALARVQTFISESRTTADLRSASEIVAELAAVAASVCRQTPDVQVVFPVDKDVAVGRNDVTVGRNETAVEQNEAVDTAPAAPNRVVFLAPAGTGSDIAQRAVAEVAKRWAEWVLAVMRRPVSTPGMPCMQWVCIPAGSGDYRARWELARQALTARRRLRNFDAPDDWPGRQLCAQSPRWPAEIGKSAPPDRRDHERDALSATNWVKRRWYEISSPPDSRQRVGFPSTSSIASATFRRAVLDSLSDQRVHGAVDALREAVEVVDRIREVPVPALKRSGSERDLGRWFAEAAGTWVYPSAWQADVMRRECESRAPAGIDFNEAARAGRKAVAGLAKAMRAHGNPALTSYLALVAQDLDGMGRFLGGEVVAHRSIEVTAQNHARVSHQLRQLAERQREVITAPGVLGVPVYLGGDDLLAFAPAVGAIDAARGVHDLAPEMPLPTASTAVLFFHRTSSLRRAVTEVHKLLNDAKAAHPDKHALAVGFLRRSGTREHSIQPWYPRDSGSPDQGADPATSLFGIFARDAEGRDLSPRLVNELERDAEQFVDLAEVDTDLYRAELTRLVGRHGGDADVADALLKLGDNERSGKDEVHPHAGGPSRAVRVAVFLRQECGRVRL